MQPFARRSFQRIAVTWSHLAHGALMSPLSSVGVQIRHIARQEEQLDALGVLLASA
jgi:hypothetical protein